MRRPLLRLCAGLVLVVAVLATGWLALGMPGLGTLQDPYYRLATSHQLLPFSAAVAGIALVVAMAARTPMAQRRLAATGLWMILAGLALTLGFIGLDISQGALMVGPARVHDVASRANYLSMLWVMMSAAALLLLVLGVVLWVSARFVGKRR